MFGTQKGITPVIAIVLLLLVTVGAVGVVYTQFQDLVGDGPDAGFLDAEQIDIGFQTTTRSGSDTMEITLENDGSTEYNMTDQMRLEYSVPGEGQVEDPSVFDEVDYDGATDTCFEGADWESYGPGDQEQCDSGVDVPSPDDEITVHLVLSGSGDEVDSYTCSPSTSGSSTC